jgi:hypothetical protein
VIPYIQKEKLNRWRDLMNNALIKEEIQKRKITRLCHFTKSQKAVHILSSEDGIEAVDFLDKSIYDANDKLRLDRKKEFVNCSIQYPNHWYWNKVKDKTPLFKDWVILLINPELLLLQNTEFCEFNAATENGVHIKKGYNTFKRLYDDIVRGRSRSSNMLPCCPTDDQAEVLIYKSISRKDIIGVVVKDEDQAESEHARWSCLGNIPKFDITIAPDLFNGQWSSKVRQGIVPFEFIYQGDE